MEIGGYIKYVMHDFWQPVSALFPSLCISGYIVLTICWMHEKRSGQRIRTGRKAAYTMFLAYNIVVLYTAFLCREPGSRKDVSLVMFETWGRTFLMHAMFIENIIMFIPFGVLLPILFRPFRKGWLCVLTGFLCSCSIEVIQHITQTGFLQLDDVLTNTAGALLGWMVWYIVRCKKFGAR